MVLMEALAAIGRRAELLPGPGRRRGRPADRHPAAVADPARPPRRLRADAGDGRDDAAAARGRRAADNGDTGWTIETPLRFRALGADGSIVEFEVEDPALGLAGMLAGPPPAWATVDARWNRGALAPYWWDDSRACSPPGQPSCRSRSAIPASRPASNSCSTRRGESSADPPVRELVPWPPPPADQDALRDVALTRVALAAPTTLDHDLPLTAIAGNLVPAVQGVRQTETFAVPPAGAPSSGPVVVRLAASSTDRIRARTSVTACREAPSPGWRRPSRRSTPRSPLRRRSSSHRAPPTTPGRRGATSRWLLDAEPTDTAYTLTPERMPPR